jgi:hypothetical protein
MRQPTTFRSEFSHLAIWTLASELGTGLPPVPDFMADDRFEALRTTTTPLVGRDEQIKTLMRRWQEAKQGDGQVVLSQLSRVSDL